MQAGFAGGNVTNNTPENAGLRPARMPIRSAVFISSGHNAWSSEIEDISATGVLVGKPEQWNGVVGDIFSLDMLIGESLDIHVEARLARITEGQLGFAYARIPENKEIPLWNLLGGYADRLEPYSA
ncbi:MAG: PilZ domain-containing protein [Dokdonella sp.]